MTGKTTNRLIISDSTGPELIVTMTGDIELVHYHPKYVQLLLSLSPPLMSYSIRGDVHARLTWEWEIMRCTGTDSNVTMSSHKTLLDSVKTLPVLVNGAPSPISRDMASGTSATSDRVSKAARILAERLRDKFCEVVRDATLPDPLASIRDAVAARGDFLLGDTIRCNDNSDLLVELYPKVNRDATTGAPLPDADTDADMDVYI